MKRARIFIAFTFLLAFAVCVLAQDTRTINSLQELNFLEEGKVKNLQFTVSNQEDIKKVFGENCEKNCSYENDWDIYFKYFDDKWIDKTFVGNNISIYKPKLEFIGKLGSVVIQPKIQVLLSENAVFPDEFECRNNTFTRRGEFTINSRTCVKNKNITYILSNESTADGKISKGQLILIQFAYPQNHSDVFNLITK